MSSSKYKSNPITKIVKLTFWTIISLYHKIIFNSVKGYLICYIQYIRGSTVKQIVQFLKSVGDETFIFISPRWIHLCSSIICLHVNCNLNFQLFGSPQKQNWCDNVTMFDVSESRTRGRDAK